MNWFVSRFALLFALLAGLALAGCQLRAPFSQISAQESPSVSVTPPYPAPTEDGGYPGPETWTPYPGPVDVTPYPGDEESWHTATTTLLYPGPQTSGPTSTSTPSTPYPSRTPTPTLGPGTPSLTPTITSTRTPSSTQLSSATPATQGEYPSPATSTPHINAFPLAQGAYPEPTGETPYPELETGTPVDAYPGLEATSPAPPTQMLDPNATPSASPSASLTAPPGTIVAALPSFTPTLTPFLTPTPSLTPTPTRTLTPLPPPPWVSAQLHATDPRTVRLASGKVQLVEFFAFWSGPSQAMAPIVQGLEQEYRYRMNFVYLDIDDPATRSFQSQLGFDTEPHFFLLDAQGHILQQWVGYVTPAQFRQAFNAALAY